MKEKLKNIPQKRWTEIGICAVLVLLVLVWALALEVTEPDREATAAQKRQFAVARVTDVLEDNAETQEWTEGRRIGQQYLEVEILTGPWKGEVLETINYLTIYTNVDAKVGTKIIVRLDLDDSGAPYVISVPNYNRTPVLVGLLAVFALLLVLIGRKKGLMALLGLVYTLACVWFILIPMILRGADPVLTAITCIVPRVLCGWLPGLLFRAMRPHDRTRTVSYFVTGLLTAVINTVLFVGCIVVFFWHNDAFLSQMQAWSITTDTLWLFLVAFVGINGIAEAAICAVVGGAAGKAVDRFLGSSSRKV